LNSSSWSFLLQWVGCATGVLGSALLAWPTRWSGWGFVAYLCSNACWIAFGILVGDSLGLVVMQCVFAVTGMVGVWRWLISPTLGGRKFEVTS
jgi:hypothetical protein